MLAQEPTGRSLSRTALRAAREYRRANNAGDAEKQGVELLKGQRLALIWWVNEISTWMYPWVAGIEAYLAYQYQDQGQFGTSLIAQSHGRDCSGSHILLPRGFDKAKEAPRAWRSRAVPVQYYLQRSDQLHDMWETQRQGNCLDLPAWMASNHSLNTDLRESTSTPMKLSLFRVSTTYASFSTMPTLSKAPKNIRDAV